jgi:protein phosphatase
MVCDHVQPLEFVARGRRGLTQPAVKCGEYLRIIYGPEYTAEQNLTRLGARAPGANRSLALRGRKADSASVSGAPVGRRG